MQVGWPIHNSLGDIPRVNPGRQVQEIQDLMVCLALAHGEPPRSLSLES
jgi:hypothetical protein